MESGGLKMAMMSSTTTTKTMISHEEGEDMGLSLRLAPPGSLKLYEQDPDIEAATAARAPGKRGFSETHDGVTPTVDWKLKLGDFPSKADGDSSGGGRTEKLRNSSKENPPPPPANDPAKPSAPKAQVVGWPPVRSFRKNMLAVQSMKNISASDSDDLDININGSDHHKAVVGSAAGIMSITSNNNNKNNNSTTYNATYVKVSMDGAPYLRKVDLKMYKSYQELTTAIQNMFTSFTNGMKGGDFLNEGKIKDLLNGTEYVPTYEDQDGDWMLVGDVPWEMFIDSCKRLRIMKGSDAINGLAPRAVESKCKDN